VGAIRVWNYNKSEEDAERGIKRATLTIDGQRVSPAEGFLVRRAPGHANFDFGQTIRLSATVATNEEVRPRVWSL